MLKSVGFWYFFFPLPRIFLCTITHICFPASSDDPNIFFGPSLAAEADSSNGSQPGAASPHHVQPDPAHAHLRWLLSPGTESARLPQLSSTNAGGRQEQHKTRTTYLKMS